ncbi:MAG: hypothetical protein HY360_03550 [Verrucomicrobia bacterium]|nr:hypothetical protein [Verrucomicrobiota bacterium]
MVSEHQANRFLRRAVVLCVLLGIGAYGAYRYTLHRLIETGLDVIRRQGYPATLLELEQWYETPPPGENAADVLTHAFAHYNSWSNQFLNITYGEVRKRYYPTTTNRTSSVTTQLPRRGRRMGPDPDFLLPIDDSKPAHKLFLLPIMGGTPLPTVNEPIDSDRKNCIAEFLQDNQETLRLLHEGARIRGCRYPSRVTNLDGLALPHLKEVRQGARFFALETLHHTENGNPDPAVFSVTDSFKYACSLERAPDLIAQLVRLN